MTKDEKKRLASVVQAAEYLENMALKLVLEHREVPNWKKLLDRLLGDKEILAGVRLKFDPIYEDLERVGDPFKALAAVLGHLPAKKTN